MTADRDDPVWSCSAPAGCATYLLVGFIAWVLAPGFTWLWAVGGVLLVIGLIATLGTTLVMTREMRLFREHQARERGDRP